MLEGSVQSTVIPFNFKGKGSYRPILPLNTTSPSKTVKGLCDFKRQTHWIRVGTVSSHLWTCAFCGFVPQSDAFKADTFKRPTMNWCHWLFCLFLLFLNSFLFLCYKESMFVLGSFQPMLISSILSGYDFLCRSSASILPHKQLRERLNSIEVHKMWKVLTTDALPTAEQSTGCAQH